MPGNAPQPGETPRTESEPWSLPDPEPTWWQVGDEPSGADEGGTDESGRSRHPRRRPPRTAGAPGNPQTGNLQTGNPQTGNPQTGGTGTLPPQRDQPTYAPEAAEARSAGREVAREVDPPIKQRAAEKLRTDPGGVERDHNRPDPFRYDPLRPPAGYSAVTGTVADEQPSSPTVPPLTAEPVETAEPEAAEPEAVQPETVQPETVQPQTAQPQTAQPQTAQPETAQPGTAQTGAAQTGAARIGAGPPGADRDQPEPRHAEPEPPAAREEPDVMVLPEPDDRNRPTVSLERGPVPGQGRVRPTEPLPRPTGDAATDARLEKLENSPFWLDEAGRAGSRGLPRVSSHTAVRGRRGARTPASRQGANRRPGRALFALITLALVASFFAWVSAEPFWLAVGHGNQGYATTTACRGTGVTQRCTGRFDAADGSFVVGRVALLGVTDDKRAAGTITPARMVRAGSRTAYLGDTGLLLHLRWILGFVLVLICGYAIAGLTGARRLDDARSRRLVILASLAAPLVLLIGFLFAAY